ncbi:flagellar hook-basal body complex protein FliE [Rhodobacteraceae bacterium 2376]|uniref:Flagellar hook-basal body complex protein FliE n=1 Tax=Rhabdonatronobacter sediminivivens TaxID=2743469 RepID=A0A7Z0I2P2_9RHOB|nr:flagellar hook-basal body complex protein FliE [Rhabdonatronobacter sediminivivens]NYS26821.1 flagellar hook-basal body complex protein FliE [Rhabdonatronobacter sediminivivens]
MDITSVAAARVYGAARPATAPDPAGAPQAMSKAAGSFAETLARGEQTANATLVEGADPHNLITALAEAELAVETAVTVRNKVVEAYLEILRMPV